MPALKTHVVINVWDVSSFLLPVGVVEGAVLDGFRNVSCLDPLARFEIRNRPHAHTLTARSCFKNWKQVSALNLPVSLDSLIDRALYEI